MKNLRLSVLALFIVGIFVVSCSKEDETPNVTDDSTVQTGITASDVTLSIMENSNSGDVIGNVEATSAVGTVDYIIKTQSNTGALVINSTTGEVTVGDANAFDYKINTVLTAVVTLNDGTSSKK